MTDEEKAKIRASINEQWRQRVIEAEQAKLLVFDPVALGARVAKAMQGFQEEIEDDISEAIQAAEERREWGRQ